MKNFNEPILIIIFLGVFLSFTPNVQALTADELQVQINALLAQLSQLQTQLAALQGETTGTVTECTITSFARNLKVGMTGDDVKCLQIVLNSTADTQLAASGVGSPGNETSYFGSLTKGAVIKFQEKHASEVLASWGLTSGTGFVGSGTKVKLNEFLEIKAPEPAPEPEPEPQPQPQPEICIDECSSEGEVQCSDDFNKQTCGNYDDDSCLEWSSSELCETDTSCGYGTCSSTYKPSWSCSEGKCLYDCLYDVGSCSRGNVPPILGEITPFSGESLFGEERLFTTSFRDPNGWQDIREIFFLTNTEINRKNGFFGRYRQNNDKLYIRSDLSTDWLGGCVPGSSAIIENSYAKIDCSKTLVSGWGNALTITWAITFKEAFAGKTYNSYLYAKDDIGIMADWQKKGEWTVSKPD